MFGKEEPDEGKPTSLEEALERYNQAHIKATAQFDKVELSLAKFDTQTRSILKKTALPTAIIGIISSGSFATYGAEKLYDGSVESGLGFIAISGMATLAAYNSLRSYRNLRKAENDPASEILHVPDEWLDKPVELGPEE